MTTHMDKVGDCCITPNQSFISYISWREHINCQRDDDEVPLYTGTTRLVEFL